MIKEIIVLFVFIIGTIISILLLLIAKHKNKDDKFTILSTIFATAATLIYSITIKIPRPIIYPLNNNSTIYKEKVYITIESFPLCKVYYTLDGTNPQYGELYDGEIIITKSTTISAITNFLFWWGEPIKEAYISKFSN